MDNPTTSGEQKTAISIIVPLAAGDDSWRELLPQLPKNWNLRIAAATPPPPEWKDTASWQWLHCTGRGRGAQMNEAVQKTNGDFLWFVHADSRLPPNAAPRLQAAAAAFPQAVHYFDLRFYDGGWRMRLNEWGVRFRCKIFNNPFGDQALCVPRKLFESLGGYDISARGEDHIFILRAAKNGAAVLRIGLPISTSARTYIQQGWSKTVCDYQKIWWRQWREQKAD